MSYLHNLTTYYDVPTRPDDDDTTNLEDELLVRCYDGGEARLTVIMTYDLIDGQKIVQLIEFVTERREPHIYRRVSGNSDKWVSRDPKDSLSGALIDCGYPCDIDSLADEQESIWKEIKGDKGDKGE